MDRIFRKQASVLQKPVFIPRMWALVFRKWAIASPCPSRRPVSGVCVKGSAASHAGSGFFCSHRLRHSLQAGVPLAETGVIFREQVFVSQKRTSIFWKQAPVSRQWPPISRNERSSPESECSPF